MRNSKVVYLASTVVLCLFLAACGPKTTTKAELYPQMYAEDPVSILVLPPQNLSTAADAGEFYATTIAEPLAFKGYYVLPIEVTTEFLRMEGIYDSEVLETIDPAKFKEYFGADAVLFTTIERWDTSYMIVASNMTVGADFRMVSTYSGETLWRRNEKIVIDLSASGGGGGLAGLIVNAVATAVKTAVADYVPHARTVNFMAVGSIPAGKYNQLHALDQSHLVVVEEK